ncbi:MAG: mechanosensitive ion channel family protein [Anaerolineae bacterium]
MRLTQLKSRCIQLCLLALVASLALFPPAVLAQDITSTPAAEEPPDVPSRVDVQPVARDEEIEARLQEILAATGWFIAPDVRVQNGVVFLEGQAQTLEFKQWAGDLARNTQDVAAVVNQLNVVEPPILDFQPITNSLREQVRTVLRALPLLAFSLIILVFAWVAARLTTRLSRGYLQNQGLNTLLLNVTSRGVGLLVFLLGLYLVFQVAGLTNIALGILGGTGLAGLVLGIAFRDITENFLASIFLSVQNPFSIGDLVEINEVLGYVQRMTTRATILMTLAGNHVQIPNGMVYKSIIHNYTSNPNRQVDFTIGIGYDDSITLAQEIIQSVLDDHPAVLNEPEHLVLVNGLGSSTVNLQIYFWLDGQQHSWLKVRSSVIRLVKRAVQDAGISMPDDAREVIFPQGVPIVTAEGGANQPAPAPAPARRQAAPMETDMVSTDAEGGLSSEANEIEIQAQQSRTPEPGGNLLKNGSSEQGR